MRSAPDRRLGARDRRVNRCHVRTQIIWFCVRSAEQLMMFNMVHRLQGLLTVLGCPVTVDGIFGPNTEAAVKDQQRAFKLAQTGMVDDNTWTKLIEG
jgi:peptidoglycan hydrolase-like protein with peptidoglycan-binding domain